MKLAFRKVTRLFGVTVGSISMLIPGASAQGVGMASTIQMTGPDRIPFKTFATLK